MFLQLFPTQLGRLLNPQPATAFPVGRLVDLLHRPRGHQRSWERPSRSCAQRSQSAIRINGEARDRAISIVGGVQVLAIVRSTQGIRSRSGRESGAYLRQGAGSEVQTIGRNGA